MKFNFPYTPRQEAMVRNPAQILWIGAGTKTGKSAALFCWLIEGLLKGEPCSFCGPWFFRSRRAFDEIKNLLEPWIRSRQVRVNEARLQLTAVGGGYIDFTSADNVHNVFGGNYARVVLDEASRMPPEIYAAALTTISATNGKIRAAFNVELGQKNWAIANLLRVQKLSPEERERTGEDFLTFPTGGDGLVDPALIELMRRQMPEVLWRALYLGEIPTSDCSLFRNLDKIFQGQELEGPVAGETYFLAADVARKKDWSVLTVIDSHGRVVAMDRFHQMSWSLQVQRAQLLYTTFGCRKAIVDATGVGDVVAEEFEKCGMTVEPFIFTVPSRRLLVEELVLACDAAEITLPNTDKFAVYREEMESMEYLLDGQSIKYAVPGGEHDDALFSLALAVHVYRASRGVVLGLLDFARRCVKEIGEGLRDAFGERLIPKPVKPAAPVAIARSAQPVAVDNFKLWITTHRAPPCPACGNTSTTYNELRKIRCNQCAAVDGVPPAAPVGSCCGNFLPQTVAGAIRCGNCGRQSSLPGMTYNGASRAQHASQQSLDAKIGRMFGR